MLEIGEREETAFRKSARFVLDLTEEQIAREIREKRLPGVNCGGKSEAMAAVHQMMDSFFQSGVIDKRTMREFDDSCLAPAPSSRQGDQGHP